MKKRTNIIILISLLGFTLSNCIDEFDAKIPDGGVGLLVVEGNIISDSTVVFSLSRTFSLNEDDLPSGYNKVTADVSVVGLGVDAVVHGRTALEKFLRHKGHEYSRAGSLVKASRRSAVASSSVMFFASGTILSKTAPRTIRRWLRVLRSSLDSF